jgi:hypothetical protein
MNGIDQKANAATDASKASPQTSDVPAEVDFWFVWLVAWFGITLAGGVFGLIAGFIIGGLAGFVIAANFAIPFVITFALLTWAFWLSRYSFLAAAIAGAFTGIVSTATVWDPIFNTDYNLSIALAGCIGSIGGGFYTFLYQRRRSEPFEQDSHEFEDVHWQYSLRDLFLRFTVVTALIACWSFVFARALKLVWPPPGDCFNPAAAYTGVEITCGGR